MKQLICLTPFIETGKRFKLESGETFDDFINKKVESEENPIDYEVEEDQKDKN
jgi:hypothetical protein